MNDTEPLRKTTSGGMAVADLFGQFNKLGSNLNVETWRLRVPIRVDQIGVSV